MNALSKYIVAKYTLIPQTGEFTNSIAYGCGSRENAQRWLRLMRFTQCELNRKVVRCSKSALAGD